MNKRFSSLYYFSVAIVATIVILLLATAGASIFAESGKEMNTLSELDKILEEPAEEIETVEEIPTQKVKKVIFKTPDITVEETVETSDEESVEIPTEDTTEESIIGNVGLDEKKTETTVESTETVEEAAVYSEVEKEEEVLTTSVSSSVEETVTENPEEVFYEIGEPPIAISEEESSLEIGPPIVAYPLVKGDIDMDGLTFDYDCDYYDYNSETYWHYNADTNEFVEIEAVDESLAPFSMSCISID